MGKLGIYLVADYPSRETFLEAVRACRGERRRFPRGRFCLFRSCRRWRHAGARRPRGPQSKQRRRLHRCPSRGPCHFYGRIYVMTYSNIVYSLGMAAFVRRLGPLSGLILADLPLREIGAFEKGLKGAIPTSSGFSPPRAGRRMCASALAGAKDFIYFVSKRGTTGGAFELDEETRKKIAEIRGKGVEVFVGFGVQERRDLETAYGVADGAIIGTRAVKELDRGLSEFRTYLKSLKI